MRITDRLGSTDRRAVPLAMLRGGVDRETVGVLRWTTRAEEVAGRLLGFRVTAGFAVDLDPTGALRLTTGGLRRAVCDLETPGAEPRCGDRVDDLDAGRCDRELARLFCVGGDVPAEAVSGVTVSASDAVRNKLKPSLAYVIAFMVDPLLSRPNVFSFRYNYRSPIVATC